MLPLFHLLVLFCRSLMKCSLVCQSPQLFPATNPSARCCCAHEASFFICASLFFWGHVFTCFSRCLIRSDKTSDCRAIFLALSASAAASSRSSSISFCNDSER